MGSFGVARSCFLEGPPGSVYLFVHGEEFLAERYFFGEEGVLLHRREGTSRLERLNFCRIFEEMAAMEVLRAKMSAWSSLARCSKSYR